MNLKKWQKILLLFLLSSLTHFIYEWFPSFFTSILCPVNESIWEHNKIIFMSFFLITLLEKIWYKDNKNVFHAGIHSALLCSTLVMILYTPIYLYILKTEENMIVTFLIFFISLWISVNYNDKLLNQIYNRKKEKIAIFLWFLFFLLNAILTYYPIKIPLFYDYTKNIYGK